MKMRWVEMDERWKQNANEVGRDGWHRPFICGWHLVLIMVRQSAPPGWRSTCSCGSVPGVVCVWLVLWKGLPVALQVG